MLNAYKLFWTEAFDFSGTINRKKFWLAMLALFITGCILAFFAELYDFFQIIFGIFFMISFIPNLSLKIRRLHDVGKRWYYVFLYYVPVIGPIWLIILYTQPSQRPIID